MAFRFKRADCIAVGTFNSYIIQPAWLAKVGIIPTEIPVQIYSKLDEPGFRFTSPKLPTRWVVTPTRVQVETDDADQDCGEAVAKVLERLPWTPLVALGCNTLYQASLDELGQIPVFTALNPKAPEGFDLAQRTVHYAMKRGETVFNLQLAATEDELELSVNVHTGLRARESEYAQQSARRFFDNRKTARALITALFEVSVSDDTDDDPAPQGTQRGRGQP